MSASSTSWISRHSRRSRAPVPERVQPLDDRQHLLGLLHGVEGGEDGEGGEAESADAAAELAEPDRSPGQPSPLSVLSVLSVLSARFQRARPSSWLTEPRISSSEAAR